MNRNRCQIIRLVFFALAFLTVPILQAQNMDAINQKALNEARQGHQDEAIADWSEVIRLNPKDAKAYYDRAVARDDNHDLNGAIVDYDQAILLDPKFAAAYGNRGYAKSRTGNLAGAILDYNQALTLNPLDVDAYNNRGNAKLAQSDFVGALLDYNETIRLNPHYAQAYNGRGNVCFKMGDLDQAITDFTRAIQLNSHYAHAYNGRGLAESGQGNFKSSLSDFSQAIALNPTYSHAYANRGFANYASGLNLEAWKDFKKAVDLDPFDLESRDFVWLTTAMQPGQMLEANAELRNCLNSNQIDPWGLDLAHFLLSEMSDQDLLNAAGVSDEKKKQGNLCEAYFYIGSKDEMEGKKDDAMAFFRRCVGTGQKDFSIYLVAFEKVREAMYSDSSPRPAPQPPAVWITGQVSIRDGRLLFTADRTVRDNPAGKVVVLASTRDTVQTMTPIYAKAAEKHLTVRLYGYLLHFEEAIKGYSGPQPNVEFITWKIHTPSDPDVLPPNQKIIITDPLSIETTPASTPTK